MNVIENFIDLGLHEKGKSPHTIRTYRHSLIHFEKWLASVDATLINYSRSDVQQYIDELVARKLSAATVNNHFAAIRAFSAFMHKEDCVRDIRIVKAANANEQAPAALTKLERQRIKREIDRTGNKRDIAIIFTLLYTGIRLSELVALDRDDIKISDRKGELVVRQGKGNKERKIPLHKEVRRAIQEYLKERTDHDPALFLSNYKKRISVRSVQHICKKLGIHPHQLRHTFVTSLVDSGVDDETIRTLTGHSSIIMVARYRSVREEDRENAIDNLYLD
ncbi:phage integrase family protein (plasmid) [Anoxybacillus sp. B7M1]|uniref:tyrosine-type recombinase/integrase n=1 Tax=Anoxybacillus sp. B7M1 TaxID=1490057 RepID=UPI0005CD325E|nr:tyrosine-type recombinase/integrase [Anoxybacillus sp. B7M1]ANB66113.1 phage integrase family protein [Anoxybacillus sp. B7M1]